MAGLWGWVGYVAGVRFHCQRKRFRALECWKRVVWPFRGLGKGSTLSFADVTLGAVVKMTPPPPVAPLALWEVDRVLAATSWWASSAELAPLIAEEIPRLPADTARLAALRVGHLLDGEALVRLLRREKRVSVYTAAMCEAAARVLSDDELADKIASLRGSDLLVRAAFRASRSLPAESLRRLADVVSPGCRAMVAVMAVGADPLERLLVGAKHFSRDLPGRAGREALAVDPAVRRALIERGSERPDELFDVEAEIGVVIQAMLLHPLSDSVELAEALADPSHFVNLGWASKLYAPAGAAGNPLLGSEWAAALAAGEELPPHIPTYDDPETLARILRGEVTLTSSQDRPEDCSRFFSFAATTSAGRSGALDWLLMRCGYNLPEPYAADHATEPVESPLEGLPVLYISETQGAVRRAVELCGEDLGRWRVLLSLVRTHGDDFMTGLKAAEAALA